MQFMILSDGTQIAKGYLRLPKGSVVAILSSEEDRPFYPFWLAELVCDVILPPGHQLNPRKEESKKPHIMIVLDDDESDGSDESSMEVDDDHEQISPHHRFLSEQQDDDDEDDSDFVPSDSPSLDESSGDDDDTSSSESDSDDEVDDPTIQVIWFDRAITKKAKVQWQKQRFPLQLDHPPLSKRFRSGSEVRSIQEILQWKWVRGASDQIQVSSIVAWEYGASAFEQKSAKAVNFTLRKSFFKSILENLTRKAVESQ
jgi:hypothetical protein